MLPIKHRLKGKKDFNNLFRSGQAYSNDALMMKLAPGIVGQPSQFGFAVSLKFSKKAVERNRAKRWMRESLRSEIDLIRPGQRIVFLVNPRFPKEKLNLALIQEKTKNLLKKAKIYPYRDASL
jgi:ribonuclease P protein component